MSYDKKNPRFSKIVAERKTKSKSAPISSEFVVDSDSDTSSSDDSESSTKQSLKRKAVEISGSSHVKKSKISGDSQDHQTAERRNDKADGDAGERSQDNRTWLSNLSDSESEGVSSSDSIDAGHVTKVSGNPSRPAIQKKPSGSDSLSDSDENDQNGTANEDGDSDSSSESAASSEPTPIQAEVVVVPQNTNGATTSASFQPPEGFSTPSISSVATANIRNLFSVEHLKGKEIWHLTVPESLSIDDIQNFTKTDLTKRKAVLRHRDNDYGFTIESKTGTRSKVFIPARSGSKYQPVTASVHQTLHLRQISKIPGTSSRPDSGPSDAIPGSRKLALKQPKGLKLGYPPIGDMEFYEDRQDTVKQAKQRIENSKIQPQAEPSSKPKKSKKLGTSSSEPIETTEWVDPESYNAPVVVGSASQHTIEFPAEPNPSMDTAMLNGAEESQARVETAETKARRKAEKAARREARAARKLAKVSDN